MSTIFSSSNSQNFHNQFLSNFWNVLQIENNSKKNLKLSLHFVSSIFENIDAVSEIIAVAVINDKVTTLNSLIIFKLKPGSGIYDQKS